MKILWIVNIIMPALADKLNLPLNPFGGWLVGLSKQLKEEKNIELHIATVNSEYQNCNQKIDHINYYMVDNSELQWRNLKETINPDVVHIHGTEFPYGINYIKANGNNEVVFSIQGLVSVIERYYTQGISNWDIIKNITFRDIIKTDNLFQAKKKFKKRGVLEKEYFKTINNVIGRTTWDKAHALILNSKINYFHGGEILRPGFYTASKWNYKNCLPYTIFLSQAGYPIKGLHQVLKACFLLKKKYPLLKIRIGGNTIWGDHSFKSKLKINGYARYIKRLVSKYNLEKNVEFLGLLSESKMIEEYQKANVFICPSSIENSSNSLAEAQFIGTPNVSAYVGGLPDMVSHGKNGYLYRFEEIEMLAFYIDEIFSNIELTNFYSKEVEERHNPEKIKQELIDIYKKISINA